MSLPVGTRTLCITGATLMDPEGLGSGPAQLYIEDGRLVQVGPTVDVPAGTPTVSVDGAYVSPGFFDMHVHLREPGQEHKETIETGTRAAAIGGFTGVACMPNTVPPIDNLGTLDFVLKQSHAVASASVHPIAAITMGQKGEGLTEMGELAAGGAVGFSDDGFPVVNGLLMRRAMEYAAAVGRPIIVHAEDVTLSAGGVMNEGTLSLKLGLKGIPSESEELGVLRDLLLAARTKCPLHVCHVSTKGAVEAIRRAKAEGVRVTAEATPHHFCLTEEAVIGYRTDAKMNPPLRRAADVDAVVAGLADGTLDAIATDHAPHTGEEKEAEFDRAPFGIIGLETALGLTVTELLKKRVLDAEGVVRRMCVAPRRILGLPGDRIVVGDVCDVTVWNPQTPWVVSTAEFGSRSFNSPFIGRELVGRAMMTIARGKVTHCREELATS